MRTKGLNAGLTDSVNYRISFALIGLTVFVLYNIPPLAVAIRSKYLSAKSPEQRIKVQWGFLFVQVYLIYSGVSLFWSQNLMRGILQFGLWILLGIAFWQINTIPYIKKSIKSLLKVYLVSALVISIYAIFQVLVASYTFETTLCKGCLPAGFGFARPNAFAIEPQFLGNLLLAPILIVVYLLIANCISKLWIIGLVLMQIALFATLSRGAIYAMVFGLLVLSALVVFKIKRAIWKRVLAIWLLVFLSFGMTLTLDMVAVGSDKSIDSNALNVPATYISQLTLGVVELPRVDSVKFEFLKSEIIDSNLSIASVQTPTFDGYVEKSTDERTSITMSALDVWKSHPWTVFFGVGEGGAGASMFSAGYIGSGKEIVQNEYISQLLEKGGVGLALFFALALGFIYFMRNKPLGVAIMLAFGFQWLFFSGLPNACHVYLALAFLCLFARDTVVLEE